MKTTLEFEIRRKRKYPEIAYLFSILELPFARIPETKRAKQPCERRRTQ